MRFTISMSAGGAPRAVVAPGSRFDFCLEPGKSPHAWAMQRSPIRIAAQRSSPRKRGETGASRRDSSASSCAKKHRIDRKNAETNSLRKSERLPAEHTICEPIRAATVDPDHDSLHHTHIKPQSARSWQGRASTPLGWAVNLPRRRVLFCSSVCCGLIHRGIKPQAEFAFLDDALDIFGDSQSIEMVAFSIGSTRRILHSLYQTWRQSSWPEPDHLANLEHSRFDKESEGTRVIRTADETAPATESARPLCRAGRPRARS